jgi:uncharacterized FlaG/YvyC family protein
VTPFEIPPEPPREVLEAMNTAARVLRELEARQVSLDYDVDAKSGDVRVRVVDSAGKVLREISPMQALELLADEGRSGIVVDERG